MRKPINALNALVYAYTKSSRDMSEQKFDAWVYGIIVGWDGPSYKELQLKHGWTAANVEHNKVLHKDFKCRTR